MTAQSWEDFRAERNRSLPTPHGWLSLTSLQWLPGEPGPLDGLPGRWSAADGVARVSAAAADGLLLVRGGSANQNQAVDGTIEARLAEDESLNWLRSGTVLLELAMRGGAAGHGSLHCGGVCGSVGAAEEDGADDRERHGARGCFIAQGV